VQWQIVSFWAGLTSPVSPALRLYESPEGAAAECLWRKCSTVFCRPTPRMRRFCRSGPLSAPPRARFPSGGWD